MAPSPRYILIGNPDSKRLTTFVSELQSCSQEMPVDWQIVSWKDLILAGGSLDSFSVFDQKAIVRLESPGKDNEVTQLLLQEGSKEDASSSLVDWRSIDIPKGKIVRPGLLHRGFCRILNRLQEEFHSRPHLSLLASPNDLGEMFDKVATCNKLAKNNIPVPESIPAGQTSREILEALCDQNWKVGYVKLNTGSSATGIVVVHALKSEPWAITSMTQIDREFYNTRRLQRVSGELLGEMIDFLIFEGVCIQRGIPLAQIDGQNFDVRVVMIYNRPAFTIFRLSNNPMTNLHLGGRRGHWQSCREQIPTRIWLDAMDHCIEASQLYNASTIGIDLVFERGFNKHYLLEVNAFGDFFPGWTDQNGKTIHRVEIEETLRKAKG